uniref:CRC domain-containing protein n=1 Tax=Heterorhabditis bacteriophora TaxID=37862 RepID=A0A1I7WMD2_HETBA
MCKGWCATYYMEDNRSNHDLSTIDHNGDEIVYQGVMLGEDGEPIFLEGDEDYVDGYQEEEYIQLADGTLVPAHQHVQHMNNVQQSIDSHQLQQAQQIVEMHRIPVLTDSNEEHFEQQTITQPVGPQVFALRGTQMFRVDKTGSEPPNNSRAQFKYVDSKPHSVGYQPHSIEAPRTAVVLENKAPAMYHVSNTSHPTTSKLYSTFHDNSTYSQFRKDMYSYPISSQSHLQQQAKTKRRVAPGQRKPCNCTKSMCLKLYCDCFANGEFCRDCNCKDCHNNLEHDADRTRAIKQSLERNPHAFKPKIGWMTNSALMNLANAATSVSTDARPVSPYSDDDSDVETPEQNDPRSFVFVFLILSLYFNIIFLVHIYSFRYPWFYMTDEVIEAATLCMVAQAEESLANDNGTDETVEEMERQVLREHMISIDSAEDMMFMEHAYQLAHEALEDNEVPVGCVFVHKGREIGRGRNEVNRTKDPTTHAEMVAIRRMQTEIPNLSEILPELVLYVTLEPCIMCACGLYELGKFYLFIVSIMKVVYGASNERFGGIKSVGNWRKYRMERSTFEKRKIKKKKILSNEETSLHIMPLL